VSRPLLLDLFCGAGGCSVGYHGAGFDVLGIDHVPQPNYPFPFVLGDALAYLAKHGHRYNVIAASPPCQAFSRATAWRGQRSNHPDLIAATRQFLLASGKPFVIENVQEARHLLRFPVLLCGSMFGLRVQRHRYFEVSGPGLILTAPCAHRADDYSFDHGHKQTERVYADAMGCDWMSVKEARQAIPPAFTYFLGRQLLAYLENR
jgi:hypothetical protein